MNDPLKYKLDTASIVAFVVGVIIMCGVTKLLFGNRFDMSEIVCITVIEGIVAFVSTLFGAYSGVLTGFLGLVCAMDVCGIQITFAEPITLALIGVYLGFFASKYEIREGNFAIKSIIFWNVTHISALIAAFIFVQPFILFTIYDKDLFEAIREGINTVIVSTFIQGIILTVLFCVYSKAVAKIAQSKSV